jgi:hypothetical protein
MESAEFVLQAELESKLVDALYLARYALTIHGGMTVRCKSDEWTLDFTQELKKIRRGFANGGRRHDAGYGRTRRQTR